MELKKYWPALLAATACGGAPFTLVEAPDADVTWEATAPNDSPTNPPPDAGRDAIVGIPHDAGAGRDAADKPEASTLEAAPPEASPPEASPEAAPRDAAPDVMPEAAMAEAASPDAAPTCPAVYDWPCGTNGALVESPTHYCVYFNRTGYSFPVSACPYDCATVLTAVGGPSICGQVGGTYVACEEPGSVNSQGVTIVCR